MKCIEKFSIDNEHEIKLFNKTIVKYGEKKTQNAFEKYFDIIPSVGLRESYFDNFIMQYPEYKNYIVYRGGTGDFYHFALYIDSFIKKNKMNEPVILTFKESILELSKIFDISCPVVYAEYNLSFANSFRVCNYKHRTFVSHHPYKFILDFYNNASLDCDHIIKALYKDYELGANFSHNIIKNTAEQCEIMQILSELNINPSKFVIFAPEAISCKTLPDYFWVQLQDKLMQQGFDVLVNSTNCCWAKQQIKLPYSKLYPLLRLSKAVIGIRSGLFDCISSLDTEMHCIYPTFKLNNTTPKTAYNMYALTKIPYSSSKIYEYLTDEESLNDIIDNICGRLNESF